MIDFNELIETGSVGDVVFNAADDRDVPYTAMHMAESETLIVLPKPYFTSGIGYSYSAIVEGTIFTGAFK